jgi:tetratricopeptide (TPR) repeat protein
VPLPRAVVLVLVGGLMVFVSVFFLRMFVSAIEDLEGRRSFLANDTLGALRHYDRALRWGAPPHRTRMRQAETLTLRLNQADLGVKGGMPGAADETVRLTRALLQDLLREAPRQASLWSLYADLAQRDAREARRHTVLDLSKLSENPLENLGPDDWRGLGALQVAASIEPDNYLYQDLLAEAFEDAGAEEGSLPHVRRALRNLPEYAAHHVLDRFPIPDAVRDAAVDGYDDALREGSLIGTLVVQCDVGEFLLRERQFRRALPYLEAALRSAPKAPLPHYLMGEVQYQLGEYRDAVPHLEVAARGFPDLAYPQFLLGSSLEEIGELEGAVAAYREVRIAEPGGLRGFFALGAVLEKLGRTEEATRQFVAATSYHPDDPSAWVTLIEYHRRHQDLEGIRRACERLLALRPDDAGFEQLCAPPAESAS